MADLIIILGSPASGKTTLARRIAADLALPCLCKDDIKEALFDVLGCVDRAGSRRYSDAGFAALLRLARTQMNAGVSCLVEGNWRIEHAAALSDMTTGTLARLAQIGCRANPLEIERRFKSRLRHPAHLDASIPTDEIRQASEQPPSFLNLPGPRWIYDSEAAADPGAAVDRAALHPDPAQGESYESLIAGLKVWRL